MTKNILLIGRTQPVLDDVIQQLEIPELNLVGTTSLDGARAAMIANDVDHVIIGGGLDLHTRLAIIQEIFAISSSTTVHLNSPSGPESFLPFASAVISGLKDLPS